MVDVTTVSGRTVKIMGYDFLVKTDGLLVVTSPAGQKTVFAAGQWESVREYTS